MKSLLKTALNANVFDDLASVIANMSGYSAREYDYPNLGAVKRDDGVVAEWFYPIANGSNDFSELSAIHMYVKQEAKFGEIGELMLGIGIVEMHHYAKLNDLITKLGGRINQTYTDQVKIGNTPKEALEIALEGERKTVEFYEGVVDKLTSVTSTKSTETTLQLVNKIIEDEKVHIRLLEKRIKDYE